MLKRFFVSILLLLAIGILCADNLVKNGSFEDGMKFWGTGPYLPGKIVPQNSSDGKNSLLIEGLASPKMIAVTQHIPNVEPGVYKAGIDIYLENHSAGDFYPLYFQILTDQGTKYLNLPIKHIHYCSHR